MRPTWKLPDISMIPASWTFEEILLEFNGPQLAVVSSGDKRYLAVAADEDGDIERWLKVRISNTELAAVLDGATSLGDVFRKPCVNVVDLSADDHIPRREWQVQLEDLNERDLPEPSAMLVTARPERSSEPSVITLDGLETATESVAFEALGDVLKNFQRIWDAMAQVVRGPTTTRGLIGKDLKAQASLSVSALASGSVKLHISPTDNALFEDVARNYAHLVAANDDDHALVRLLGGFKVRVRSTYRDFLATLHRHDIQFYMTWERERVFLGPHKARRILDRLLATNSADEENLDAEGFFLAVNIRKRTFVFYDTFADAEYSGSMAPDVFSQGQIVVGTDAIYQVTFSVLEMADLVAGPSYRYQLIRARRWTSSSAEP